MRHHLFFAFSCALILGVIGNHFFDFYSLFLLYFQVGLLMVLFLVIFLVKFRRYFTPLLLAQIFIIGCVLDHKNQYKSPFQESTPQNVFVNFELQKKLNSSDKYKSYLIKIKHRDQSFNAVLKLEKNSENLDFLHLYTTRLYLIPLKITKKSLQNFDYAEYLARQNVFCIAFAKSENIKKTPTENQTWGLKLKQWRQNLLDKIVATNMNTNTKEFLKSIILSDRTDIDKNIIWQFNKTGLVHLLAISGSHIVVAFWLIQSLFSLFIRKNSWQNITISLCAIVFFGAFVGFGNSIVRSCLMLIFYYLSVLLKRQPNTLHSLSLAAFVIVLHDSNQVWDLGFQLSFVAVLGIYWLYQPLKRLMPSTYNAVYIFFQNTFALTLSAQISTFPLIVFLFGNYSLSSLVYNLIMVPVTQFLIIFSFFECAFIGLDINFKGLDLIYNFCSLSYLQIIDFMANNDPLFFEKIGITLLNLLGMYVLVYYLRKTLVSKNLKTSLFFLRLIALYCFFYFIERQFLLN